MIIDKDSIFKEETFKLIEESINQCEFYSIDFEMTGITKDMKTNPCEYDFPQLRYEKHYQVVKEYDIIQIGISFFLPKSIITDKTTSKDNVDLKNIYIERTFVFYLYKTSPFCFLSEFYDKESNISILSNNVKFTPETLKFHIKNGFDIHSLVDKGIHYNKLSNMPKLINLFENSLKYGKDSYTNNYINFSKSAKKRIMNIIYEILNFIMFPDVSEKDNKDNKDVKQNNKKGKLLEIDCGDEIYLSFIISLELQKLFKLKKFIVFKKKNEIEIKSDSNILCVEIMKGGIVYDDFFDKNHFLFSPIDNKLVEIESKYKKIEEYSNISTEEISEIVSKANRLFYSIEDNDIQDINKIKNALKKIFESNNKSIFSEYIQSVFTYEKVSSFRYNQYMLNDISFSFDSSKVLYGLNLDIFRNKDEHNEKNELKKSSGMEIESDLKIENKDNIQGKLSNKMKSLICQELGFSLIVNLLSKSKKPMIGHNTFFDMMFLYDKFIDNLPKDFSEFLVKLNTYFPIIYDTKVLATYSVQYSQSKLESLLNSIYKNKLQNFVDILDDTQNGFCLYQVDEAKKNHDAGFDSRNTGRAFIYLIKAFENEFKKAEYSGWIKKDFIDKFEYKNILIFNIVKTYPFFSFNFNGNITENIRSQEKSVVDCLNRNVLIIEFNSNVKTNLTIFNEETIDLFDPVIYEMAKIIESENYSFKLFKIDSNLAYVEIMNLPVSDSNSIVINEEIKKDLLSKIEIKNVYNYHEFYKNYKEIIKF